MNVVKGGLRAATRMQDAQKTRQALSKCVALGTKYHLFFPVNVGEDGEPDDIRVAFKPGYSCDSDALRVSFVKLDDYDVNESGAINDRTGLKTWAKIASVLYKASEAADKAKCQREAEAEAEATGKTMQDMSIALATKLRDIELAYEGNAEAQIYPTKRPLIRGIDIKIATEVLIVPMVVVNGVEKPDWTKTQVASFEPSKARANTLMSLLEDANFHTAGVDYLEVIYDYGKGCTDKQQAGRQATFQGCTNTMSLATIDPDGWAANKEQLSKMSKDAEAIEAKNFALSRSKSSKEIKEILKSYISKQTLVLSKIDMEADITSSVAKDMVDLGLLKGVPKIQDQLIALAESVEADRAAKSNANEVEESPIEIGQAKSLTELVNVAESAGVDLSEEAESVEFNSDVDLTVL